MLISEGHLSILMISLNAERHFSSIIYSWGLGQIHHFSRMHFKIHLSGSWSWNIISLRQGIIIIMTIIIVIMMMMILRTNTPFQQDAFQDTLKWLMILKYHFSQAGYHHQWQLSSSSWWWWFSGESCASSILPPTPLSHLSCVPAHISQVRWSDYDDKLMIW